MMNGLLKNKTAHNAGWLIGGKIGQMCINLVVGLLTARYLGPSNYGVINYAAAYTAFFTAFCTLGINSILVKEFIDYPDEEGTIIGSSLFLQRIASLLSIITILSIVYIVDEADPLVMTIVSLSCLGLLLQIFNIFNYWFQAKLQSKIIAINIFVAYFITAVYKIYLMATGKNIVWFAMSSVVDYTCIALLVLWAYKRNYGQKITFRKNTAKRIISKSYHFILPSVMVAVYAQTDKIMLKQMISSAEIGYYSTAHTISGMWCFVLAAIIDAMYPEIAKAYNTEPEVFEKRNKQLYAIVFYISTAVSLIITILAEFAVNLLYGEAYLPAAGPLRIITWYTAFSYLGVARNVWIVCKNKQKYLKYVYAYAAITNVTLNLIFIPLWGAKGAAVASLVSQIITIIVPFFIKEIRENTIMMVEAFCLKI